MSLCDKESSGVNTQLWTQSATLWSEAGKKNNTSVTPRGITLSPEVLRMDGITESYVWTLARDMAAGSPPTKGQIYVGTGDPGSVYKLDPQQGKPLLLFRSTELHVHTLAVSPSGEIYAGTSPQGHVYRISPQGEANLFCDLPANYVWKLVFDGRGNLYAATGPDGIIYKISAEGKADVFFDSSETHLLDLIVDRESNLYACSEPNGLVYKISPSASGGQAFILYDAEEGEVHCLAMDSLGQLYAGTASGARPRIPMVTPPPVPPILRPPLPTEPAPSPINSDSPLQEPPPPPPIPRVTPEEGLRPREAERPPVPPYLPKITNFVYRITPNGTVKKVLEVPQALVFSLSVDHKDNVLVGTGSEARIYKLDTRGETCTLLDAEETQVLCLLSEEGGFFYGTGNAGRLFLASNAYCREGSFESEVFDAKFITTWGNLSWEGNTPEGTKLTLSTRTGNSKKPDNTWSPWSEEYTYEGCQGYGRTAGPPLHKIQSPASRFIQYRARLVTARPQEAPLLQRVSLAYLPQNQAPDILSLSVGQAPPSSQRERYPRLLPPARGQEPGTPEEGLRAPRPGAGGRETKCINWKATDPNGDSMRCQLFYKGRNERDWKPMTREEIKGDSFCWQTTRVPDGEYLVRLLVSDEPDNPPDITLSAEKVSEPFLVDNTRPLLLNLISAGDKGRLEVSGLARDELSSVTRIEYSVDAVDWKAIFPRDNIFDSREEDFQFTVEGLSPGEHTIIINATDAEGNIGSGKVLVEIVGR
ncbi:MAG: WD40 repeat domain-containing protein [Candidatus Brocadiaceae bacterium]|nr:WD40 repeat domain-containing protein [Candidatus Brocadiaceae bacterium]